MFRKAHEGTRMTAINSGRWICSITGQPIVLGFNNWSAPVFPPPQPDAFNIEVFTNTTVPGVPNADPEFQSSINDPGGVHRVLLAKILNLDIDRMVNGI